LKVLINKQMPPRNFMPNNEKTSVERTPFLFPLQARVAINDLELAKKDFELVLQIEPNNREVQKQLNVVNKKIKQHMAKEKVIFGEFYKSTLRTILIFYNQM